jgi:transcriptional regulator with XRE-family HTH domain
MTTNVQRSTKQEAAEPLGARLRRLRRAAGHKQATLAARSGLSRSVIASIEIGRRGKRPNVSTLQALADVLGLTPAQLVGSAGE